MKKLMIIALFTMSCTGAFAQKSVLQGTKSFLKTFEYTFSVGLGSTSSTKPYSNGTINFDGGLDVKKYFMTLFQDKINMYGMTGFHLTGRGGKIISTFGGEDMSAGNSFRQVQFCIPMHVGLKYSFKNNKRVFADFGPYVSFNGNCSLSDGYGSNDYEIESNKMDFGISGNIGFCLKKFGISIGMEKGFMNIAKFTSEVENWSEDLKNATSVYFKLQWTFNKQ